MGRAHGGPCFKPSCAYPWRRVIRRLTPQRGLLPSTHAGGRLGRRQPVRASHLNLRPSSKVEVLPPSSRGSRPSGLVAGVSLLFPRAPAKITTFKCVERSRSVCLNQTYEKKHRRKKRGEGVHSDDVSTGCQLCPTDSNGEVVTSIKRIC